MAIITFVLLAASAGGKYIITHRLFLYSAFFGAFIRSDVLFVPLDKVIIVASESRYWHGTGTTMSTIAGQLSRSELCYVTAVAN